jgi:hypothetical protein
MSVTFTIHESSHCRFSWHCTECATFEVNVTNVNAVDLLQWLGLEPTPTGSIAPSELAARCRRRLWPEPRNLDPGVPGHVEGRVTFCGRAEGYLRQRTRELLRLAERAIATSGRIEWA